MPQLARLTCFLSAFFSTFHFALGVQNALSSHPPLRCCFMQEPPISFHNKRKFWNNGLDGVIMNHLLQHQSYLNWSCSSMRLFSHTNNTSFNAFVSLMHKCTNTSTGQIIDSPPCTCDVGIGGWFQTSSRFGLVDFLPPFAYDRYVVFTHVSEATFSGKIWFFIRTFDGKAWLSIFGLFLMFSFLKTLDKRFAVGAQYQPLPETYPKLQRYWHYLTKSDLPFRLRKAFQSTVMRFLGMSDETVVRNGDTMRQWLLNMILGLTAIFLVLSYEAAMTASLVQESIKTKFESATDLVKCNVEPSEVCILKGGALETYWENSIAIGECHINNPPLFMNSYKALFQAVSDGGCKYAIVIESSITAAIREEHCGRFVIVGQPIWSGGLSILLPRGSNLTEPMSRTTLELIGNQTTTAMNQYLNGLPHCHADVKTILSFQKLRPFFIIAYSMGLALLLAMVLIPQPALRENGSRELCIPNESAKAKLPAAGSWKHNSFSSTEGHNEAF